MASVPPEIVLTLDSETRALLERAIAALDRLAAAMEQQQAPALRTPPSGRGPYLEGE